MSDKAIRSALLTAKRKDKTSENIADYVADLLRQGRASEVTDDLMAQADPQRLHHHYTTGNTGRPMPMDKASRMARAAEMGFINRGYHGSNNNFSSFSDEKLGEKTGSFSSQFGHFTTSDPSVASNFGATGNVMPVVTKAGRYVDAGALAERSKTPYKNRLGKPVTTKNGDVVYPWDTDPHDAIFNQLKTGSASTDPREYVEQRKSAGVSGFDIPGTHYDSNQSTWHGYPEAHDVKVTFDPTNIRSDFARFDPRLSHLAHLSASTGGAMDFARHVEAVNRAGGQIAPSKYLPDVPRQVHADGGRIGMASGGFGYVPQAALPQLRLAVAQPLPQAQPKGGSWLNTLTDLAVAAKKPEEAAAPAHGFGATMPPSSTPAPTSGAAPQTGNMSGFYAPFKSDLDRLIAEAPGAVTLTSGYRTPERQQELWDQHAAKYPDPEVRDNYVARPGSSSHNYGLAADLSFASPEVQQWVHDNAAKYNLQFRMDHEGWHIEPINLWELREQIGPPAGYADGGSVGNEGIDAYHGSPHDFDQFDISKLGTGEGAQAYGHGLYFAGNENVAKAYRDQLSNRNETHLISSLQNAGVSDDVGKSYASFSSATRGGKGSVDDFAQSLSEKHPSPVINAWRQNALNEIPLIKNATKNMSGHMYKVKLNIGQHELLDWDRPLSKQHPNVQAALARIDPDQWHPTGGDYDPSEQGQMAYQRLVSSGNKQGAIGEHLRAGNPMKRGDKWASEALMAQGIKGIRYRDAGSRGDDKDGDPTHNYVMFHHDPVKVADKYAYGGEVEGSDQNEGTEVEKAPAAYSQTGTQALGLPGSGGVRGSQGVLPAPAQTSGEEDLTGLPKSVKMPKLGQTITAAHDPRIRQVSRDYAQQSGIQYNPPTTYQKVDPARAKRIADAYEAMPHEPNHPLVKASYEALLSETKGQYEAMKRAGVNLEFYPDPNDDPYKSNPRLAVEDVKHNNHMYIYPTDAGYGSGDALSGADENPLLRDSGERWHGKPVLFNDLFRAVHDYFGHAKEGVGFRADGEENAWRQHAAMFSPLARIALGSETRGQNSWLNYGPHGDKNRTAATEDTVFADQKLGVLPHWVHHEGAEDFIQPHERKQMEDIYRAYGKLDESPQWSESEFTPDKFSSALKSSPFSSTLTQYDPSEVREMINKKKFSGYKLAGKDAYFGIKHGADYVKDYGFEHPALTGSENALVGVVNNDKNARGVGDSLMKEAIKRGVTALDAFAVPSDKHPRGFLADFYGKHGFKELGRVPFDPKYVTPEQLSDMKRIWAKSGWDEKRHPFPDVVIMKRSTGGSVTGKHRLTQEFSTGGAAKLMKARKVNPVDTALSLTRRFTKDGKAATMALKPKGK